jgi:hypothetical protein
MKLQNTLLAIAVATASINANADLAAVGASDPVTGFPAYYQDYGDLNPANPEPLALDLCLPNKVPFDTAELADGSCLMLSGDGTIPDESQPISFPDNFPDEAFYYNASAGMTLNNGSKAILVLAVEAAFTNAVRSGDQIVFSRLRYRFRAPSAGYYTIETPYSTDGPMPKKANELVFNTEDVGVNCGPGVFSCALAGSTGPYLRPSATRGGTPKPLHVAHGNKYLAQPGINTLVTGAPNGKNWFRILYTANLAFTPTAIGFTDQFQLMGRLYDKSVPKPIPRSKPKPSPVATVASPRVSITAVDSLASEASGDPGKFMINLNAPSAKNIRVKYSTEGKAIKGKDYRKFNSSMLIPAGSVFGTVDVWPVNDKENERTEKVTLKLSKKGIKGYSVKGRAVAHVKILDDD